MGPTAHAARPTVRGAREASERSEREEAFGKALITAERCYSCLTKYYQSDSPKCRCRRTTDMADDHDHDHGDEADGRTTAPQSDYTAGRVALGAVVAAAGLAVTFGVPLLLL